MQAMTPSPRNTVVGSRPTHRSSPVHGDIGSDADSSSRCNSRSVRRVGPAYRSDSGSGAAIGVVLMFPMLMMLIMGLHALTESARIVQALQATADRAAHTAALCCHYTGTKSTIPGSDGYHTGTAAVGVVLASLKAAETAHHFNRVYCNNNLANDSETVFIDANGNHVAASATEPVPPGGLVLVFLTCNIPPQVIGISKFSFFRTDLEHFVQGTATVDPYRVRSKNP